MHINIFWPVNIAIAFKLLTPSQSIIVTCKSNTNADTVITACVAISLRNAFTVSCQEFGRSPRDGKSVSEKKLCRSVSTMLPCYEIKNADLI